MLEKQDFLFEGLDDSRIKSYEGIVSGDSKTVLCENMEKKKMKIKKGDKVGTISMLINEDDEADSTLRNWTEMEIREKVDLKDTTLDDKEKDQVYRMLKMVGGALSRNDADIGDALIRPHGIELMDETPIWQKARSFAQPINEEIERQCEELEANDIIEHSDSRWSSPCVPVRKPDGSLRLCIDYRKLNSVTKSENFPMPNVNNCLYRAHKMQYLTKLDLVKGYYQVKLENNSRQYTAFSTVNNHYQFKRLAFGLKNSGIAFQRAMQQILHSVRSSKVLIYIDDILIMSEGFEKHLQLVKKVLTTLQRYGLKIKMKKCEFFRESVDFLGHVLSSRGIRKSPDFMKKVEEFPQPVTVNQLRRFLGLVNFQRKFVERFSDIARPLSELTGGAKKEKIDWTEDRLRAFERLKEEVKNEVILSYPDYSEEADPLELFVDCLEHRIWCSSSTEAGR